MPWLIGHVFYICSIYNPSRAPCGVTTASRKVDLTSALCSEGPPRYFRQSALCQQRTVNHTIEPQETRYLYIVVIRKR